MPVRKQLAPLTSGNQSSIWPTAMAIQHDLVPSKNVTQSKEIKIIASPAQQDSIIIWGTKEKKHILSVSAYQEKLGSNYPDLIITQIKGKPSCVEDLSENRS
jgi:hypothetical protein